MAELIATELEAQAVSMKIDGPLKSNTNDTRFANRDNADPIELNNDWFVCNRDSGCISSGRPSGKLTVEQPM